MPFKANADRRHHIPRQRYRAANSAAYDAAVRQRGSLTVWFTDDAIAAWKAKPRGTGRPSRYSELAIATALTLQAVFRLALRQTEGLIGSIVALLGLDLAVPDHTTLSRRAETLQVPRLCRRHDAEPLHLLVDSTGLKLCGAGEWFREKHGTKKRRDWRTLHIGTDSDTGEIVAATLTGSGTCDASQVGPLLEQVFGPITFFTADSAYDWQSVYDEMAARHPDAAVVIPPRCGAMPTSTADNEPTQRDQHIDLLAKRGRTGWQAASSYNWRALVEADVSRSSE